MVTQTGLTAESGGIELGKEKETQTLLRKCGPQLATLCSLLQHRTRSEKTGGRTHGVYIRCDRNRVADRAGTKRDDGLWRAQGSLSQGQSLGKPVVVNHCTGRHCALSSNRARVEASEHQGPSPKHGTYPRVGVVREVQSRRGLTSLIGTKGRREEGRGKAGRKGSFRHGHYHRVLWDVERH